MLDDGSQIFRKWFEITKNAWKKKLVCFGYQVRPYRLLVRPRNPSILHNRHLGPTKTVENPANNEGQWGWVPSIKINRWLGINSSHLSKEGILKSCVNKPLLHLAGFCCSNRCLQPLRWSYKPFKVADLTNSNPNRRPSPRSPWPVTAGAKPRTALATNISTFLRTGFLA